jgi:hypothetical protein
MSDFALRKGQPRESARQAPGKPEGWEVASCVPRVLLILLPVKSCVACSNPLTLFNSGNLSNPFNSFGCGFAAKGRLLDWGM